MDPAKSNRIFAVFYGEQGNGDTPLPNVLKQPFDPWGCRSR